MLRKKWISLLVAISMVAAMFPSTVFADTVEATEPVEPQTSVTETAQEEKEPGEEVKQPEDVNNENTATGEADKGTNESEEDETVVEETKKETETPADETEEKTEDVEKTASEEADTDEETVVVPPVTTPEVTENPVAGNSAVDTQALTGGDKTDDGINTEEELRAAIASANDTITLSGDVAISSTLTIDRAVTLDLGTHKIYADTDFQRSGDNNQNHLVDITASGVKVTNGTLEAGGNNNHTLNVWNAKSVTLENLTLDNTNTYEGAPLIVGASDVTLQGTITTITGKNSWYAINVDCRMVGGTAVPATLTAGAKVLFQGEAADKPGICVENTAGATPADAKVVFADGFSNTDEGAECSNVVSIHPDNKIGATIDHWIGYDVVEGAVARIGWDYYTDLAAACAAAKDDETVVLCISQQPVELDSKLVLDKEGVTLDLNGNTLTAAEGFGGDQPHLIDVTANNVTITNGTLQGTEESKHGVNVYGGSVTLDDVTVDVSANSGTPLVVNGAPSAASATLSGNVELIGEGWYAIDLDKNSGYPVALTVADGADIDMTALSGINVSSEDVSLTFGKDTSVTGGTLGTLSVKDGTKIEGLENVEGIDMSKTNTVAIVDGVVYTNQENAIDAVEAATGECTLTLYKDFTLTAPIQVPEGLNLTVEGNDHTITLPENAPYSAFNNNTGLEGLKAGTDLTVNNVKFVGDVENTNSGHAVVIGFEGGVDVNMTNCIFENLYDAVYANPVQNEKADPSSIMISGEFDKVKYSYSLDNVGGRIDKYSQISVSAINGSSVPAPQSWGVAAVNNVGYATLEEALKAAATAGNGAVVQLLQDVQLDSKLVIDTEGVTIDLARHTISASDKFNAKGHLVEVTADGVSIVNGTIKGNASVDHALHIWDADDVTLGKNLVLDNSATTVGGAPLVIGASNVTLEGNTTFVTGEKSWYGANVDSSIVGDKKEGSSLTVEGNIVFQGPNMNNAGIWVEDSKTGDPVKVTVSFGENSSAKGNGVEGFEIVHIVKTPDGTQQGTVTGGENAGLITDEDGNYVVKPAPVEETPSHEHSYVWQGSPDEHWQYCTDCGQVVSNGAHTFQWKDGAQVCSVCGYKMTETSTASAPASSAKTAAAAPAAGTAAAAVATGIPQTGDASNPMLWVVLLAVSGSALGGLMVYKKKKEN